VDILSQAARRGEAARLRGDGGGTRRLPSAPAPL